MRIISLNTWGGRALHPLMHFFKQHGPSTDIFCLQEMHDTTREYREARHPEEYVAWDLLERTRKVLAGHDGYFARWADNPHRMSVALFVRHGINVREYGTHTVLWPQDLHEEGSAIISPRKLQYVRVGPENGPPLTVVNYHGMWRNTGKLDTPERIVEMKTLAAFVRNLGGPLVLCGDFNLEPNTQALSSLARIAKLAPLVGVGHEGTRTPLYRHYGYPGFSKHADNIYLTHDLTNYEFDVMSDVVSDHAALRLTTGWTQ